MWAIFAFLPGAWVVYGLCRWALSYSSLNLADQVALSSIAALIWIVGVLIRAMIPDLTDFCRESYERWGA